MNQEPQLPEGEQLSEESKVFRETYQKTAGMPARMRAEEARDAASGDTTSEAVIREEQRAEAGMPSEAYEQKDFQDVDPSKAVKPQQSAEEVIAEREAPPAGDTTNVFDALANDDAK